VEARHFIGRLAASTFSFETGGRIMKVYADPGTEVRFSFATKASPSGDHPDDKIACISGRLEPVEDGF
jgi:hypothetical protein